MALDEQITLSALKFVSGENVNICRLCFQSTETGSYSFEDSVKLEKTFVNGSISFIDMFSELGLMIDYLLPDILCTDCAAITINSYMFQKICQYSMEKWAEALQVLEDTLVQTEHMKANTKTVFLILNKDNNVILSSGKTLPVKKKTIALAKVKNIMSSRIKYAQMKKEKKRKCDVVIEKSISDKHVLKNVKFQKVSQGTRLACPQCARYFATKLQLKEHSERVHYPKIVKCGKCTKKFGTERMLKRHEKIYHTAAICKLCFVQFSSKNALRAHLDKHEVNKCEQCKKSFLNRQTYKLHLKICGKPKTKQPNFFCDICSKGYVRKNGIRTHLKTEHGFGNVHTCSWCNKKYDAISRLKNHIVKHTRERNFHCEYCGGKFVTQAALVYHIRLHTGERPYPCDMCGESFLSVSRRMEHKRRKHFEPTKECTVCHVKFVTSFQLRKHMARHYNPHSKLYVPTVGSLNNKLQVTFYPEIS